MKVVSLCGSRNPEGQTACAADAVLKGAERAGASIERVFLPELSIERCRQCDDDGWGMCRQKGHCVIDDDLSALVEKVSSADVVIFSTPVYYSDLSESLRAFIDRLRRIYIGFDFLEKKPVVGICVAGGSGGGATSCCSILERVLETCGFEVVNMFPVRRQNLQSKLPALDAAGQWMVSESP